MAAKKCLVCGKETKRNCMYCSTQCRAESTKHYKNCVVCGKKFWCSPSEMLYCCGPACSSKYRSDVTKQRPGNTEHLINQRIIYSESHSGELNPAAKHYGIITPQGNVIDVLNLRHWVYNSGLFDNPSSAYGALLRVVSTFKGTISPHRRLTHYAGYSIAYCDDGNVANSKANQAQERCCKVCGSVLPPNRRSYCNDECANVAHNQYQSNRYHAKNKEKETKP